MSDREELSFDGAKLRLFPPVDNIGAVQAVQSIQFHYGNINKAIFCVFRIIT